LSAYSFINTTATIVGPGGAFSLGYGSGNADEGIEITRDVDDVTLVTGAGGEGMYSLNASKNGTVRVTLLKTSPVNAQLMAMRDLQRLSSSTTGNNTITVIDTASGDTHVCRQVAFKKAPDIHQAKEPGTNAWEFIAVSIDSILGVF
jgi:hypothetical protein